MTKTLSVLVLSLFTILTANAQKSDTLKRFAADTLVFESVEQEPEFPGGMAAFYKFLEKNSRYPKQALFNKEQGRVIIQMVVEKDGTLTQIAVVRSVSPSLDQEAIRIIKLCPPWKAGMQNGRDVRVKYTVPITFKFEDKTHTQGF